MIASRLTEIIQIFSIAKTKNVIGESILTNTLVAQVFADVFIDFSSIVNSNDTIVNQTVGTFTIREYPVINYDMYIVYKEDKYNIVGINEMIDRSGTKIKAVKND